MKAQKMKGKEKSYIRFDKIDTSIADSSICKPVLALQ